MAALIEYPPGSVRPQFQELYRQGLNLRHHWKTFAAAGRHRDIQYRKMVLDGQKPPDFGAPDALHRPRLMHDQPVWMLVIAVGNDYNGYPYLVTVVDHFDHGFSPRWEYRIWLAPEAVVIGDGSEAKAA